MVYKILVVKIQYCPYGEKLKIIQKLGFISLLYGSDFPNSKEEHTMIIHLLRVYGSTKFRQHFKSRG